MRPHTFVWAFLPLQLISATQQDTAGEEFEERDFSLCARNHPDLCGHHGVFDPKFMPPFGEDVPTNPSRFVASPTAPTSALHDISMPGFPPIEPASFNWGAWFPSSPSALYLTTSSVSLTAATNSKNSTASTTSKIALATGNTSNSNPSSTSTTFSMPSMLSSISSTSRLSTERTTTTSTATQVISIIAFSSEASGTTTVIKSSSSSTIISTVTTSTSVPTTTTYLNTSSTITATTTSGLGLKTTTNIETSLVSTTTSLIPTPTNVSSNSFFTSNSASSDNASTSSTSSKLATTANVNNTWVNWTFPNSTAVIPDTYNTTSLASTTGAIGSTASSTTEFTSDISMMSSTISTAPESFQSSSTSVITASQSNQTALAPSKTSNSVVLTTSTMALPSSINNPSTLSPSSEFNFSTIYVTTESSGLSMTASDGSTTNSITAPNASSGFTTITSYTNTTNIVTTNASSTHPTVSSYNNATMPTATPSENFTRESLSFPNSIISSGTATFDLTLVSTFSSSTSSATNSRTQPSLNRTSGNSTVTIPVLTSATTSSLIVTANHSNITVPAVTASNMSSLTTTTGHANSTVPTTSSSPHLATTTSYANMTTLSIPTNTSPDISSITGYVNSTTAVPSSSNTSSLITIISYSNFSTSTASIFNTSSSTTASSLCSSRTPEALPETGCNGPESRNQWCNGKSIYSDTSEKYYTGATKTFTLTITNTTLNFDGIETPSFAVNGQSPGPAIEVNWGDMVEVTVINLLENNATTIHWHGIHQYGTNDQDGVPGVSECGIVPGSSKVYTWHASSFGTGWYHSHLLSQYGGGIRGPVIIHGPTTANYDLDMGTVQIDDIFGATIFQEAWRTSHIGQINTANYLLNGKNLAPDLSRGQPQNWTMIPGKRHLFRIINSSGQNAYAVHFDQHTMQVVAADYVPIKPYETDYLYIVNGQRYDVIIEANQPVGSYYLRAITQTGCPSICLNDGLGNANGIISYEGACDVLPNSTYTSPNGTFSFNGCQDEPLSSLVPWVPKSAGSQSELTASLDIINGTYAALEQVGSSGNIFRWFLNGGAMNVTYTEPTLKTLVTSPSSILTNPNNSTIILNTPSPTTWVYFVIQNSFFVSHPMHLHGHDFSVLGSGPGLFTASLIPTLNFNNPTRRDTTILYGAPSSNPNGPPTLAPSGWTLIAFQTDNPGAWLMHCHIIWHSDGGMALQYIERPGEIKDYYGPEMKAQCKDVEAYEDEGPEREKPDYESGIKKMKERRVRVDVVVDDKGGQNEDEVVVVGLGRYVRAVVRH